MIDTEALRKKVLDLAIQGKLTEQLPSDGTAEELYAKIQEEKARLIKEGKIKKEKPLPAITEKEIPFDIPKNWKWVRFGNLMWNRDSERIPVSVDDRKKLKKIYDYYGASGVIDRVEEYIFDTKLLLIGEDGANLLSRSIPIAFIAEGKYWVNNHAHVLGYYLCDYLDFVMHYINSISLVPYVTGTAQPKLNQDNMNRIPVPLPPFEEQVRIVSKIDEIFVQIDIIDDLQSKYIKDSAALKSKILDAAIRGRLVEQRAEEGTAEELYKQIQSEKQKLIKEGKIKKDKPLPAISKKEIPFDIPESWKWVHLNNIATSSLGKTLNNTTDTGEEVPYLCSINVYFEGINLDKLKTAKFDLQEKEKYRLQKGDLLICEGGDAGRSAIWDSDEEMYYQNALHRVRFFGNISARYMCFVLEYYKKKGIIADYTRGDGIQHLVQSSLYSIWLPLPPLAEQRRIVARIEELLPLCERLAECREKA